MRIDPWWFRSHVEQIFNYGIAWKIVITFEYIFKQISCLGCIVYRYIVITVGSNLSDKCINYSTMIIAILVMFPSKYVLYSKYKINCIILISIHDWHVGWYKCGSIEDLSRNKHACRFKRRGVGALIPWFCISIQLIENSANRNAESIGTWSW